MKNIIVLFNMPGMTAKQYDQVWQDLRATGHSYPDGLLYHAGTATADGWMVIDEWESQEHFNRFGEILMPIMEKNNVPQGEPTITSLHYGYSHILAEHHN